jgi:signal transduction histidine kinase
MNVPISGRGGKEECPHFLYAGRVRPRRESGADAFRQTLQEFSRALTLIVGEDELQQALAAKLKDALSLESVAIFLVDERGERYRIAAGRGIDPDTLRNASFPADGRLARWLRINEAPLLLDRSPWLDTFLGADERAVLGRLGCALCFPLVATNRLLGFVALSRNGAEGGSFVPDDDALQLVNALAGQAALALENASLQRDRSSRLRRMYRAERLAAAGQLAAGAAHEIRNPLAAIRSAIQLIARDYPQGSERSELIADIVDEVDRIDGIVEGLLSLARPEPVDYADVDLLALIRQTLALTAAQAEAGAVQVTLDAPAELRLHADPGLLKQLLLNLVLNALQAMPQGGRLELRATAARRRVQLVVQDTGGGIEAADLERIFDPFYTTRPEGTGLGLAICHGIVERHGGEITVESAPGAGATFTVELPQRKAR